MTERRAFLLSLTGILPLLFWNPGGAGGQLPEPPRNPQDRDKRDADETPVPRTGVRALLKENQKEIQRDVERLFRLAGDLKKEVDKTDSADVLSLPLVRKAEEIEKLAKKIKNLARAEMLQR